MAAAACPSCLLGPTSTSLLSFTYHAVETITVSVIPHVTVYTNGTEKTSFERITETDTDFVGGGANATDAPKTFSDKKELTWTVGDATLTWPTTYVQYCGFEGATASPEGSSTCAQLTDAVPLAIPSTARSAPFIYPLETNTVGATTLPAPLLDYIAQLPQVSEQFGGYPLTGCAPLTYQPSALTYSTIVPSGISTASIAASSSASPSSALPGSSQPAISSISGNFSAPFTTRIRPTQTLPALTASYNSETTERPTKMTQGVPSQTAAPSPAPSSAVPGSYSQPPAYSPPPVNTVPNGGTLTHSTAFVIEPITGPTTYTTISGPEADHTKKPHNSPGNGPGYTQKPDGTQHHTGKHDGPSPGNSPHHTGEHVSPAGNAGGKPHQQTPPVYTHGHTSITANSNGAVVVGSQTVKPGHKITIGSGSHKTEVALQTDHGKTRLNIGGSIYNSVGHHANVTPAPKPVSVGVVTTGGHEITVIRSGKSVVLVDGTSSKTVRAGEEATFEGQTISIPNRGGSIAVNGHGFALTSGQKLQATVTAGGHTFTALDAGKSIVVKDKSSTIVLGDGEKTVFRGESISAVSTGNAVVVDGKTVTLSAAGGATTFQSAIITAGGHTITAHDKSGSVILNDGSSTATVRDGRTVIFEGQSIRVLEHGSAVVVNGKTTSFSSSGEPTTTGVGAYITGGLGKGGDGSSPSATSTVLATTGSASSIRAGGLLSMFCVLVSGLLGALIFL